MKIKINNRDKRIEEAFNVIKQYNISIKDLNDTNYQNLLMLKIFKDINNRKSRKAINSKTLLRLSSNNYRILIDSYERALAKTNLILNTLKVENSIGYVYFISNPAYDGYIKVGCSKDAESRLNSYQTSSPFRDYKIEKYIIVRDYRSAEKYTLSFLNEYLFNGEWIKIDEVGDLYNKVGVHLANNGFYNRFGKFSEISEHHKNIVGSMM